MILLKYIFLFVLSTDDWTQLLPKEKKHFRCFKRNYVSDIRAAKVKFRAAKVKFRNNDYIGE